MATSHAELLHRFSLTRSPIYTRTRIPPDASDQIVWVCDEAAGSPIVRNSGVLGPVADLPTKLVSGAFPINGSPGLFAGALDAPGEVAAGYSSSNPTVGQPTILNVQVPFTISGWLYMRGSSSSGGSPVAKAYRPQGTWSAPFVAWHWLLTAGGGGTDSSDWSVRITRSGVQNTFTAPRRIARNVWHHIGWTWDGSTVKVFSDGDHIREDAFVGTIDYGTNGPFMIGCDTVNSSEPGPFFIHDVRIANVVRAPSYFRTIYEAGVTRFGAP